MYPTASRSQRYFSTQPILGKLFPPSTLNVVAFLGQIKHRPETPHVLWKKTLDSVTDPHLPQFGSARDSHSVVYQSRYAIVQPFLSAGEAIAAMKSEDGFSQLYSLVGLKTPTLSSDTLAEIVTFYQSEENGLRSVGEQFDWLATYCAERLDLNTLFTALRFVFEIFRKKKLKRFYLKDVIRNYFDRKHMLEVVRNKFPRSLFESTPVAAFARFLRKYPSAELTAFLILSGVNFAKADYKIIRKMERLCDPKNWWFQQNLQVFLVVQDSLQH